MGKAVWRQAAVFLIALGFYAAYARHGALTQDEGWLLDGAMRVGAGQVPHRDFVSIYPAGRYYLVAGALELLDNSPMAMRWTWAVLRALVFVLTFAVARRLAPAPIALAAALVTLILPGPWHKTLYALVPLLGLLPLLRWVESRRRAWLLVTGVAAGVGLLLRQDTATFLFVTAAAAALLCAVDARARRRRGEPGEGRLLRDLGALIAGSAAVLLPVGFLAWSHAALGPALSQIFLESIPVGLPTGAEILGDGPESAGRLVPALLALVPVALALVALVLVARAAWRGRLSAADARLGCVALLAAAAANQLFRERVLLHLLQCGPLIYLLIAGLSGRWLQRRKIAATRPAVSFAALALPAVFVLFVALDLGSWRLPAVYAGSASVCFEPRAPLPARGSTLYVQPESAAPLQALVAFITRNTAADEPIFVLSHPSALYFLADRPNPTHRTRVALQQIDAAERERLAREVYRSRCRYIVTQRKRLTHCHRFVWETLSLYLSPVADFGPYVVLELLR